MHDPYPEMTSEIKARAARRLESGVHPARIRADIFAAIMAMDDDPVRRMGVAMLALEGVIPDELATIEADTVALIVAMTKYAIGAMDAAGAAHQAGDSEALARLEVLDKTDPITETLSEPIRRALESHVRQVVAESFDGRRESRES